ncbi:hypothetical protein THRCLA_20616 [Thraustotheca clavata]|uniref:Uncharacterized protein n=1 Tax=Thraustotheca clavata TaxID=74557 RepID=A0A1W0A5H3_9STRA|nr:hypothetical protein THRCLA_20616 [Thraustotheca clavata]
MFTQCCFVDFNKTWTMSNSYKRQTRCQQEIDNGALLFATYKTGGKSWLHQLYNIKNSIDKEFNLWNTHGITRFQLQWQNYKTMGMVDRINIVSALGFSSPLTIATYEGNNHIMQQTSMRITLLFQNLTLIQPLSSGLTVLQSSFVEAFNSLLVRIAETQIKYYNIPRKSRMCEVPSFLLSDKGIMASGGNIMCGDDVPIEPAFIGLLSRFGKSNVCNALFLKYVSPITIQLLFGLLAFNTAHRNITEDDLFKLFALDSCSDGQCATNINFSRNFVLQYSSEFTRLTRLISAAYKTIQSMQIQIIQFYTILEVLSTTNLYTINILEPTEQYWIYYGWFILYHWVIGIREVVEFQGDAGSIVTISYRDPLISLSADPTGIPISFSSIFTIVLITLFGCYLSSHFL